MKALVSILVLLAASVAQACPVAVQQFAVAAPQYAVAAAPCAVAVQPQVVYQQQAVYQQAAPACQAQAAVEVRAAPAVTCQSAVTTYVAPAVTYLAQTVSYLPVQFSTALFTSYQHAEFFRSGFHFHGRQNAPRAQANVQVNVAGGANVKVRNGRFGTKVSIR